MRILLDEDLNTRLRHAFSERHHVETVDDYLPDQRNFAQYDLAVVVLRARSKSLDDLQELILETERVLPLLRPGEARRVCPPETREAPGGSSDLSV